MTQDGGRHWTSLPAPPARLGFYTAPGAIDAVTDLTFADAADGFLFKPALFATHNSARTWARQALPPVTALAIGGGYVYVLTQADPSAPTELWRSQISATNWNEIALPAAAAAAPSASPAYGSLELAIDGSTVVLLKTGAHGPGLGPGQVGRLWVSRGGVHWRAAAAPCRPADGGAALLAVTPRHSASWLVDCFDNEQSSQEQNTQHHLYATTDAGLSWARLTDPTMHNLPILLADNGSGHAFLATDGVTDTLVGTLDQGQHWQVLFRSGGSFTGWADLRFVNSSVGFIVGATHYAPRQVYRTDDGGRTWRPLPLQ